MNTKLKIFNGKIQKQPPEVFYKKGVLKNFTKFTGKHLCQSLFVNKVAGPRPATLLKKRLWHRCFSINCVKGLRTPFLQKTSGPLLLKINPKFYDMEKETTKGPKKDSYGICIPVIVLVYRVSKFVCRVKSKIITNIIRRLIWKSVTKWTFFFWLQQIDQIQCSLL